MYLIVSVNEFPFITVNHSLWRSRRKPPKSGATNKTISEAHEILSCCEVYNLDHKKWNRSYLKLPYSLYDASVVVDSDETFALITGNFSLTSGGSNKVITFTEQNGFSVFDRFALKIQRFGHVSTIIE